MPAVLVDARVAVVVIEADGRERERHLLHRIHLGRVRPRWPLLLPFLAATAGGLAVGNGRRALIGQRFGDPLLGQVEEQLVETSRHRLQPAACRFALVQVGLFEPELPERRRNLQYRAKRVIERRQLKV